MIYRFLHWIAGIALYWFYREIRVVGDEKIPARGPILIAVNHQNALVDSLIAGWVIPRRITMTAKATLTDNPLIAALFRTLGVVPLRRASDESRKRGGSPHDRSRNTDAFREILRVLEKRGAVLIFPEGKSHNEVGLEPLKTGLARLALKARDEWSIKNVRIIPMGLVFEDKGVPGSIVGVRVGNAIELDSWPDDNATALTEEVAGRLRAVSEEAGLPLPTAATSDDEGISRKALVAAVAWWGRLTHRIPIRFARALALRQSRDPDEPAMLTIMFGIGLVLLTYAMQVAIVGVLAHSFLLSSAYLASLVSGAYWAAFEKHPQRY